MNGFDSVVIVTDDLDTRVQAQRLVAGALGLPTIGLRRRDMLEANTFWQDNDVALVLLDDAVAGEDDYRVVKTIVHLNPGQLIIVLGRNPDDSAVVRAFEAGATEVLPLPLPLHPREAAARLKAVLRSRQRVVPSGSALEGFLLRPGDRTEPFFGRSAFAPSVEPEQDADRDRSRSLVRRAQRN